MQKQVESTGETQKEKEGDIEKEQAKHNVHVAHVWDQSIRLRRQFVAETCIIFWGERGPLKGMGFWTMLMTMGSRFTGLASMKVANFVHSSGSMTSNW